MNWKGRLLSAVNDLMGSARLQPVYEKIQRVIDAGMNLGAATRSCGQSGEAAVMELVGASYNSSLKLKVFDVGAHTGEYTSRLLDTFGDRATIFAFEPSSELFAELSNRLDDGRCRLFNTGFGEEKSVAELYSSARHIPTMLKDAHILSDEKVISTEQVKIEAIDEFCKRHELDQIHFLKVDVEGFELSVLKGASTMIAEKRIDFIQFEFGLFCVASRTYMRDFFDLLSPEYRIFRVLRRGVYELKKYETRLERFDSVANYLAVSSDIRLPGQ
ncbi:MAG: FkbM family methyltransferase [Aridibacter famidurans]|nr:FkbM family methyltransferase [Aridibacter famidurans]